MGFLLVPGDKTMGARGRVLSPPSIFWGLRWVGGVARLLGVGRWFTHSLRGSQCTEYSQSARFSLTKPA